MENHQSTNRYVVEPAAAEAVDHYDESKAAADALIRAEEMEAEAARAARSIEEIAGPSTDAFTMDDVLADEKAVGGRGTEVVGDQETAVSGATPTAAVGDRVEAAAATVDAASPGAVSVHASETALNLSSDDAASRSGSGRVREAARTPEAGVTSETVAVRYGVDDGSRGRPRGGSSGERRRRTRSVSYVDGSGPRDRGLRDEVDGRQREDRRVVTREDRAGVNTPVPLLSLRLPRHRGGHVPQFCPPPPFPTETWGVAAGGEPCAERSHAGGRPTRPAHRSGRRSRDRQRDGGQARVADRHRDGRRSRSPRRPRQ